MGGFTSGMFGQPNYQPTQGTGQNPSVSIGFGMEPPEFQEGLSQDQQNTIGNQTNMFTQSMQQPTYQPTQGTQQNPSVSIGMPGGILGSQPQYTPVDQGMVSGTPNLARSFGFGGGKSASMPAPAPGQNPSVSMGMPIQQPAFLPDTRGPGGFGNDYNGNPLGANGLPLQMTMSTSRPAQAGAPMQQPNRFIPPNAPGAGARRPVAGVQLPGQTGMARPRTAPQPLPMNRFRNRFI